MTHKYPFNQQVPIDIKPQIKFRKTFNDLDYH